MLSLSLSHHLPASAPRALPHRVRHALLCASILGVVLFQLVAVVGATSLLLRSASCACA